MSEPPPRAAPGTPSHQQQNTAAVRSTGVKEHNSNFTEQANRHEIGSWDQFEANKKLIQDASTYDDLMYTTPIPQHIPLNWQKKMEHKAQSIEKNPTSDHGRHSTKDEETAFASVRRNEILRRSQTGESSLKIKIRKETRLKKTPKKVKVILRSSDLTKANLGQADMSHDEGSESSSASGSDISEDDRVAEVAEETMKAPDQILKIINDWGKGTTCDLHWKFRHSGEIYQSIGEVVTRHSRKGTVRVKISYTPQHQPGPSGFLYLPASHKINIFRLLEKKFFQPVQRGILHKNACEGIVHELLDEYTKGHAILAIDYDDDDDDDDLLGLLTPKSYGPSTPQTGSPNTSCDVSGEPAIASYG